jgi:hypothetical protein
VTLVSKLHSIWSTITQESNLERKGQILREKCVFRDLLPNNVRPHQTMSDLTRTRSNIQFWVPETSNQTMSGSVGQCSVLPNNVWLHWTMSDWQFQLDICSLFWSYFANWVSNWSHSFSNAFITSRESILHYWLVCSSPSCRVFGFGIELGTYASSYKRIWFGLRSPPPVTCLGPSISIRVS